MESVLLCYILGPIRVRDDINKISFLSTRLRIKSKSTLTDRQLN